MKKKHKNVGWVLPKLNKSTNLETSFPVDVPSTNQMIFIYIYTYPVFSGDVQPEYAKLIQATEATA